MTLAPPPDKPNFRKVVRGLLELHRLAAAGKNESDEADAVRDFMDAPWACLSEAEKARVAAELAAQQKLAEEAEAARLAAEEAELKAMLLAEQKAARDARYAARKAAKKQRRKGD